MINKYIIHILIFLTTIACISCGRTDFTAKGQIRDLASRLFGADNRPSNAEISAAMANMNGNEPSGNDALSASTNQSDKDQEKAPKLNAYEGAAFVKPPQINNYGTVTLAYEIDAPPGRKGVQPGVGLSYSSSGGDGLAGIGWSLSTGLGVISRTTKNGQLYYDERDTFTFNGQRLVKAEGATNSEDGAYRLEIESGFSKFVLSNAANGGVWRVYDKAGTVTVFGEDLSSRIFRPDDHSKTYIWNFCKSVDLNGNTMTAEYDDSRYADDHILYLKEIRYTGNDLQSLQPRQYVRFAYTDRDEAYVSKAPGFIMRMDRLLDKIAVGWDDPLGLLSTDLWTYRLAYDTSEDSNRPLLKTIETERETTRPEFIYQPAVHSFTWAIVANSHASDSEENPDTTKYFEGDFNGDGISDMVFFNPKTGAWRAMEGNRDGGYFDRYYGNRFQGYEGPEAIQWFKGNVTGDYNGDGRSDIAFYLSRTKEFWVAEHNGKTFDFRNYGTLNIDTDIFKCEWFTGDYNGDGLSDTVLYSEPTGEWILMANKGGRFEFIRFSQHFKNLFRSDYTPDLNLDSPLTTDTSDQGKDRDKIFFLSGDYNGDGRTDISFYDARSGKWWVGENYRVSGDEGRGSGFELKWKLYKEFNPSERELFAPRLDSLAGNDRFSGDFNGDGFSDFLIFHKDTGEWILGDTGDGNIIFRVFSRTPAFKDITRWLQGDFNGDGRTDIGFFSKSDNNFWIGEATPDGFRYKVYNNLSYGPDPARVLATPLPRDEVQVKDAKAVITSETNTAIVDYQYDGNYHTDRGEKVFPGYFTDTGTAELLIFDRKDDRLYLKQGASEPARKLDLDLYAEDVSLLNGERPSKYRGNKDGVLYYRKTKASFGIGSDTHSFNLIYSPSAGAINELEIARFDNSTVANFNIAQSVYLVDQFNPTYPDDKQVLVLDDRADWPRFVLFSVNGSGTVSTTNLSISGLDPGFFADLRERRSKYQFLSGKFTESRAQVLFVDMTSVPHQWYRGSLSDSGITFTKLSGTPQFARDGYIDSFRVVGSGGGADLIYATVNEGLLTFHKLIVGASSISQINYMQLAKGYTFKGEFDHADNPVVHTDTEVKRALLGSSCRLETLAASIASLKRPDLMSAVYPFQWIQGDYNGDGKTDLGIFHLKERSWYFALTQGTVPDLINKVKNGIGGFYYMTYENSTRFDNTDEDGVPHLPMNYKVCTGLTIDDGLSRSVLTTYEYARGYAFSAYINGEKETDYFGFGEFTVVDGTGKRAMSRYNNVPYEDFRMNRALAGAVRETEIFGSDKREYERTENEYKIHVIGSGVGGRGSSFLVEPIKVQKFVNNVPVETRASNIELTPGKYEMVAKAESVTDHFADGVHQPVTATSYSRFDNIESTNEMRLQYKKSFDGTAYETTASYEYDSRGNVIRETTRYSGAGLPTVADKVMEYAYDGYGNRIRETNASGSPNRVTEKSYDERLHQFVVQERAIGDAITLVTGYEINYASAFGGVNKKTDPNGATTYFEYDVQGRLFRESIDSDFGVELLQRYDYDTIFPLSAKVTQYAGVTSPPTPGGGAIETRVYADGMGRVIHTVRSATGAAGKRYSKTGMIVYDYAGKVVRKNQSAWAEDDEIDTFKQNKSENYPTVTEYDPAGRVTRVILPEGYKGEAETSISYTYNDPWEVIETHSVGRSKRTVKNARGQVLYIEDSGRGDPSTGSGTGGEYVSAKIGFAYNIAGNRVKKMDLNNTSMSPDVPANLFTPGTKDTSGNNIACWRYNAFGQVTDSSDPDLGYAGMEYTAFGEVSSRTDGLNRVTSFFYDRLGRLTEKRLPGTEGSVLYAYDSLAGSDNALGRMVAIDDPAQRKEFSYERIGRVKREKRFIKDAGSASFETHFEFDLMSRKTAIHYPLDPKSLRQMTVRYGYCAMGVKSIEIANDSMTKSIVTDIAYNEFGQMTGLHRGNSTITSYTYDIKGRLESLLTTAQHNGQTWKVQDVKYEFKVDNSITAVENSPDVDTEGAALSTIRYEYAYDGLNRLAHATGHYEKTTLVPENNVLKKFEHGYNYAVNGNLTAKTIYDPDSGAVDDAWSYIYSNHAATAINTTKAGSRFAMVYDAAGNMISQSDASKNIAKEMAYDSFNRIRQVTDPSTGTIKGKYSYDDQGFRVWRKALMQVDGQERQVELLYPSMYFNVDIQRDQDGNLIDNTGFGVNNIFLNGVRIAAALPNGDARYYLSDQVDSVKCVLDDSGIAVTRTEYLPFGETWFQEGDTKNAPKYNSQELDKESGYYFYNARHYDPEIARFVTPDTVIDGEEKDENGKIVSSDPQGWNRYSYCKGNPIIYKDPTGHKTVWLAGAGNEKNSAEYSKPIVQKMEEQGIKRPMYLDLKNEEGLFQQGVRAIKSALGITDKSVIDKISKTYDRSDGQYNLVGYSKGAVEAGKAALDMANKGKVIDNLVLIGSPIKTDSDLYKSLTNNKNIKKITKIDIQGDFLTNKEGKMDMGNFMEWSKKVIKEKGAEVPHFYYTTNKDGQQDKLVTNLKKSGLK